MEAGPWWHIIPQLRAAGFHALELLKSYDFGSDEETDIAHQLWKTELTEKIGDQDFEGGWHCVRAATLGFKVFEGPQRLCRGHLEGLPVGIVCGPLGVLDLIQTLARAMQDAGVLNTFADVPEAMISWQVSNGRGEMVEMMRPGHRVAHVMERQYSHPSRVAARQASAIAHWANNHRRFAARASARA